MKDCKKCLERQALEAKEAKRNEKIRFNVNPDSVVGKEIMYQTVLLQQIMDELHMVRWDLKCARRPDKSQDANS